MVRPFLPDHVVRGGEGTMSPVDRGIGDGGEGWWEGMWKSYHQRALGCH